uniref:Uncharacterized protein n=1 Tax=Hemiselmis andersenii TaxID=464988 RepID=A0A6U2GLD8_HEMAN|mmetsp:Transcript_36968/g.86620  ORF Transcript_36968/g.86620 Transcript_36968/m.86620 type:complete len:252 (+) Transcript_36968:70-825(+)
MSQTEELEERRRNEADIVRRAAERMAEKGEDMIAKTLAVQAEKRSTRSERLSQRPTQNNAPPATKPPSEKVFCECCVENILRSEVTEDRCCPECGEPIGWCSDLCYAMGNGSPEDDNIGTPPWPESRCGWCDKTAAEIAESEREEASFDEKVSLSTSLRMIGYQPSLSFRRCYHSSERNVVGCDDVTPHDATVSVRYVRESYLDCHGFWPINPAPEHAAEGRLDMDDFVEFCFFAEQAENQQDSPPSSPEG